MSQNNEGEAYPSGLLSPPNIQPKRAWEKLWHNNKGIFLILCSMVVGSTMDTIARFLQLGDGNFHPFQVIFARMSITFILSTMYMWWTNVPDFPLGTASVRGLLVLRAFFGFFGLYCLYYSVHYLPLAEATIFRFLVPIFTAWACSIFLGQMFSKKDLAAGVMALIGVMIIAHPAAIFEVSHTQRLIAIAISVLGVFGASGAYTIIRVIGNRAHALISVNYFAVISTLGSTIVLLVTPGISFVMPRGAREWVLLLLLGVLGFILQFLLTAGLQLDKSSAATTMLYTQVLFALLFDWSIWGVVPGTWSCVGGAIVIASTLWSALSKSPAKPEKTREADVVDEETTLLAGQTDEAQGGVPRRSVSV